MHTTNLDSRQVSPVAAVRQRHILIVDDHTLVADMLELFLKQADSETVRVSKAASVPQALALVRAADDLSLVLLDLHMPDMDGFAGLRNIRTLRPDLPVLVMSGDTSLEAVRTARENGARGYVRKTAGANTILDKVRRVLAGEPAFPAESELGTLPAAASADGEHELVASLSPREREVLNQLVAGESNKGIAKLLGIELVTVSMHLTHIYRKLKVTSRTQAVRLILR